MSTAISSVAVPTALEIATKEYGAAEADWQRAMKHRHTGQAGARAYRAACDALVAARKGYAAAFWAERDGGAE